MATPELLRAFAPTGRLRVAINVGNAVLAAADAASPGGARGISVDIANELARRLGVTAELLVVATAKESVAALEEERVDLGFFAIDPARAATIAFTAPYVLIEGAYAVPLASPLMTVDDVDRPGVRVVVGSGSAYDLHLSRALKAASVVRAPSSQAVVSTCITQALEVAAGVRQQLELDLATQKPPLLRLLPGRFMVIQQAMGVPKSRGAPAHAWLSVFVEEMKASGFVADAMRRHGVDGATVAPPAVATSH